MGCKELQAVTGGDVQFFRTRIAAAGTKKRRGFKILSSNNQLYEVNYSDMLPKRLLRPALERRLSPPTEQHITSARRLQICSERLIIVALGLWLPRRHKHQPP